MLTRGGNFLKFRRGGPRNFHQSSNASTGRVLVVAEHEDGRMNSITLNCVNAAKYLRSAEIEVLVAGSNIDSISNRLARLDGVTRVLRRESPLYDHGMAEPFAKFLAGLQKKRGYTHILGSSSSYSKNVMPRVAALLDVQPLTDVLEIKSDNTFIRPIYAGNALVTCKSEQPIQIFTIRHTSFEPITEKDTVQVEIESVLEDFGADNVVGSKWIGTKHSRNEFSDLTNAQVVICGGRGMGDADKFKILYELAGVFGENAAVGASRAAVDSGFISNDFQIGQTGKIVAPELYIGVGISGAIQHLAGIKDSKKIIAINKDPDAPIFKVSDYGMVGDLFQILPDLIKQLKTF